jgi:hypothetical protein
MRSVLLPAVAAGLIALTGCGGKPADPPAVAVAPGLPADPPPTPAELVDHPVYLQWGRFPVGTTVTRKTTTDSEKTPGMTVTTIVYTLKDKGDDFLVLETQATTEYHGGRVDKNPPEVIRTPRKVALPSGINKEEWGKPKGQASAEEVTVAGKTYRARRFESKGSTDAGELFQTVWSADDMPGGLVKSVSRVPKVEEVTTIEVTEVRIPK